jgi:maltose/moltooligosaccharide transporter
MKNVFHFANTAEQGGIPENVRWSFYIGSFFFIAAVLYTVFTTSEYPPTDTGNSGKNVAAGEPKKGLFSEIMDALSNMPKRMRIVSLVQFFTWPALFLMWFYYTTAVAVNVFHGKDASDPVYATGADFGSLTLSFYSVVTFLFALVLPSIADKLGRKTTHSICLLCGAIGLISVNWIHDKNLLFGSMIGIGIAWASILSMPYAMLSGCLPKEKVGIYMGIFNFFIVLPEIVASLGFGWLMKNVLHNDRMAALTIGGGLLIVAALICYFFIKENRKNEANEMLPLNKH